MTSAVTLVQAPLGVGKTTALRLALCELPGVAWVDAKPWHRGSLPRALVAALRDVRPDFGRLTLGAIEAGAEARTVGLRFAEDLTHVDEPLVLAIDDVHVLHDDLHLVAFCAALFSSLPAAAHVVLSGRAIPELALGELFGRGRAALIDADLFAFGVEDVTSIAVTMNRHLSHAAAEELVAATNGWATGIVLTLSASTSARQSIAGRSQSASARYISEQLLPTLAPSLLLFLEESAVFETLDLRVLAHLPAFSDAAACISGLRRSGALVSQLPDGQYRVAPVLRMLAQERLDARGAASQAHAAAASAYAAAHEMSAALFHAEAAQDAPTAVTFLRTYAEAGVATGDDARVRMLAARIDPAGPDRGLRWYVDALLGKTRGEQDIREKFALAASSATVRGDRAIAFNARASVVEYDLGRGCPVDICAIDELHSLAGSLDLAAWSRSRTLEGWSYAVERDFATARRLVEPLAHQGDADARFNIGILLAYAQTALGECDAAEATLDTLLRALENDDRLVLQTLTLIWLARLGLLWGRTNLAADAAAQAERLARAMGLQANEAALYVALAEVASHFGDVEALTAHAERARRRAAHAWYLADINRVRAFADIALARAAFLRDDFGLARELALRAAELPHVPGAQRAVLLAEAAIYTLLSAPTFSAATISAARDAIAAASAPDASDALAVATADDLVAFLDAANGLHHRASLTTCAPFAALIEWRRGLVTLEVAGMAVGNARRGTGRAAAFESALSTLTAQGPRFEVRLARAYAGRFIPPAHSAPCVEAVAFDLTPRENEILRLLVDGLTNKEIAQRLVLSTRTVESHVERVLGKLEVGSRSRAIAKAIRLGVVELDMNA